MYLEVKSYNDCEVKIVNDPMEFIEPDLHKVM